MKKPAINFLAVFIVTSLLSAQWTKQSFPTTENLWKIRFATEQAGWIAGHNYIYKTTNGGTNWTKQDTSIGACDAMFALNDQTAMFANWTGAGEVSRGIRRTTDGGTTWTTVNSEKNYYTDIDFGSATVGYASSGGTSGNIPMVKKTTDAGATWTTISQNFPKTKYELTGISFVDENVGWTVTYDGFVFKTTNGGSDWALQDSLGLNSYRDIDFFDQNYGWIVGGISGYQELAYTTNGGTKWNKMSQGGCSTREVKIMDKYHAWYCGSFYSPFLAYIDTAGNPWKKQQFQDSSSSPDVASFDMVSTKIGYAIANLGRVYKTTNGGVASVKIEKSNIFPINYSLEQNFPNPFNPSTTVRFSIPVKEDVSLKIFSINGELIEELIGKPMDAGSYSITWHAEGRPSGVYFYTLTSGNFSETKKLALLK